MDDNSPHDPNVNVMAPWAIKSIAQGPRKIATEAAQREGLTVGQWLERLIMNWHADGGPTPVQAGSADPGKMTTDQLIRLGELAVRAKEAGQGGMSDVGQVAGRVLSARLRAGEGLPPPAVRLPPRSPAASLAPPAKPGEPRI